MNYKLKKNLGLLILLVMATSLLQNCFTDNDDNIETESSVVLDEVKDFVWKAMNFVYLYKDEVPDLADDRFTSNSQYQDYLNSYSIK